MKKSNSKRYVAIVIAFSVVVVISYAIIAGMYLNSVLCKYENNSKDKITSYADVISNVDIDVIKDMTQSNDNTIVNAELIDPSIAIILYEKRIDNTAKYYTENMFLSANKVGLKGKLNVAELENIAGKDFMTYELSMGDNYFVKLAMPYNDIAKYYIDYSIALSVFTVLCIIVCFIMIYTHNKLVFDNIEKQRVFINDMSHEIRTPLTVIKGNLENMLACPDSSIMDLSDTIETSLKEVDHLTSLSQNLLNIVSDTRTVVTKKMSYNLSDMISGVLEIYSDIISGENKTLIANIDSISAIVDTEKIKQLIIILLDNAIKYTREGDKIKVQIKKLDGGFEIVVADTGIGIDNEDKDKIFERFYRGANAKEQSGTGLGLSIARSIVLSHGGSISATHNIPSGLVITAFIPNKD